MSTINYAVELTTDSTSITDVDYGLVLGVFRWITGRPGYTGVAPYPTNEDTTNNTSRWFEDYLLIDGMGNPNRRVDLTRTGDYGTLSGFDFKIRNDQKFWDFLDTNDIFLCNRSVKVYVVIDGVFYQIWDGVVNNEPYNETDYQFVCVDKFKTIHKEMPPYAVNETSNPGADRESLGQVIPITFGDVQYAQLVKLSNVKTIETLIKSTIGQNTGEYQSANAFMYTISTAGDPNYYNEIWLVTAGVTYTANQLKGKYLCAVSGEDANSSRLIEILANEATAQWTAQGPFYYVKCGLAEPLDACLSGDFIGTNQTKYRYNHGVAPTERTWWFQVVEYSTEVTPSSGGVVGFVRDTVTNLIKLFRYDSTTGDFIQFQDSLYAEVLDGGLVTSIKLRATSINQDGQIEVISPIPYYTYKDALHALHDMDQSTFVQSTRDFISDWQYGTSIPIWISKDYDYENVTAIYLGFDLSVVKAAAINTQFLYRLKYDVYDPYGRKMDYLSDVSDTLYSVCWVSNTEQRYFLLPKDYYTKTQTLQATDWGNYTLDGNGKPIRRGDLLKLPSDIVDMLKTNSVARIEVSVGFKQGNSGSITGVTVKQFQLGLFSTKYVDTIQGTLYGQVTGESLPDGTLTNTVYGAFRLMLETYDGILPANIDYGNLATVRADWPVSRQMIEKKNSFDYLKELAEQSYVAIAPTRTGKRLLSAWRDNETLAATHTETSIVRDSIKKYQKTEVMDLYNDYTLVYAWNIGTQQYERTLKIKSVDQTSFPAITTETWKDYVSGVNPTSYADAQVLWSICRRGYLRSKAILTAPDDISQLNWYADSAPITTGSASPGCSVDDSAWKYLNELCQWCTRQKETVTYRLPITATHIQRELLDYIKFSDAIYTANTQRPGWITYVEVDTKNDQIIIEATLNPAELAFDAVIIERGIFLNVDTVTEGVNQTDTYSEPQVTTLVP